MADTPTLRVMERGEIAPGTPRTSYRQGLADLLDFTAPPTRIAILPPDAPAMIGLTRLAEALHGAMDAFRKTKP
jgi:hypothetical protein